MKLDSVVKKMYCLRVSSYVDNCCRDCIKRLATRLNEVDFSHLDSVSAFSELFFMMVDALNDIDSVGLSPNDGLTYREFASRFFGNGKKD